MSEAATLSVVIDADMTKFDSAMKGIEAKMQSVGKSMENVGKNMTKFVTLPLVGIGTGMAAAVMELEASEAKYNTVFAGMTDEADAFLNKFKELTPATMAQARNMASGIQDLLVPMGFAREEATAMTGEFMHVAGALANFNSGTHSAEDVTRAMQSAVLGQYQSLAQLGIQLDVATVKQKAVEMGLASSTDEVTKQMQAQVVLAEVYAQSGDALEAYTEENLDAKTKMALAKAEIIDVAASFGQLLLPTINRVIDVARGFIETLGGLSEEQQRLIMIIGGVVAAIGPMLMAMGKVLQVVGLIGAPMAAAGIAIALLAGYLVKLYITSEEFRDKVDAAFHKVKEVVGTVIEAIKGYIDDAIDYVQNWQSNNMILVMRLKAAWATIKEAFEGLVSFLKENITLLIQSFMEWWNETEGLREKLTTIFNKLKELFKEVFMFLVGEVTAFVRDVQAFWDEWGEMIMDITKAVFNTIKGIIDGALTVIMGVLDVFIGLFTGDWKTMRDGIVDIMKGIAGMLTSALSGVFDALTAPFTKAWNKIKETANNIRESLENINPFKRNSPSLVDNVKMGAQIITREYQDMSDIDIPKASETFGQFGAGGMNLAGSGGGGTANIYFDVDGRTMAKIIGQPLTDEIRLKTGMRL